MTKIQNPILRGFSPDPSIIRVEDDYYIATSTFEWFPGVQIHHSRDLLHWELIAHPLNRISQLDLRGAGASQGVWAPCLTYDNGIFYLVYTVVHSFYVNMYDTHNYLVTTTDIRGDWSEPVFLNSYGFDPSLYHDDDGRKYIVSMMTDHRVQKPYKGRLVLQEYSVTERRMIGEARTIFASRDIFLEGPHLYKRNGYYYLFAADTGTGEGHGQSILRSRELYGPYEYYEGNSILTSRNHPEASLQKAGHGDLAETQNGEWYMVHLCGRPLKNRTKKGERKYTLGRETAIQKVEWTEDGWLRLASGSVLPELEVEGPALPPHPFPPKPPRDDFDSPQLDIRFQSLRIPLDETFYSLSARKGYLRLYGREGLGSKYRQSLIARRWQAFAFTATTCLEFEPTLFKQMAGLICLYDYQNYYYLHITHHEQVGRCLSILSAINNRYDEPVGYLPLPEDARRVHLRAAVNHGRLQFAYSASGEEEFISIGPSFDASTLSDEACQEGWFTGAFVGICCQDLTGFGKAADFDYFEYREDE
ncbi:glycoside hydrolase family 43 protein [Paenibacillus oralis]|uniref:Glycoside hydrolase family 43 protein n=1 Tax=Paenibacillus oralis TaxID=2490856 RepID=A0A3P3U2J4_9BACL|nr:glycoside hydrolase family 43 protein [Paenibacillus oralis]RRJ64551.1 glycoside hydrolase family 43 protein [Paenibacillus oralis]